MVSRLQDLHPVWTPPLHNRGLRCHQEWVLRSRLAGRLRGGSDRRRQNSAGLTETGDEMGRVAAAAAAAERSVEVENAASWIYLRPNERRTDRDWRSLRDPWTSTPTSLPAQFHTDHTHTSHNKC